MDVGKSSHQLVRKSAVEKAIVPQLRQMLLLLPAFAFNLFFKPLEYPIYRPRLSELIFGPLSLKKQSTFCLRTAQTRYGSRPGAACHLESITCVPVCRMSLCIYTSFVCGCGGALPRLGVYQSVVKCLRGNKEEKKCNKCAHVCFDLLVNAINGQVLIPGVFLNEHVCVWVGSFLCIIPVLTRILTTCAVCTSDMFIGEHWGGRVHRSISQREGVCVDTCGKELLLLCVRTHDKEKESWGSTLSRDPADRGHCFLFIPSLQPALSLHPTIFFIPRGFLCLPLGPHPSLSMCLFPSFSHFSLSYLKLFYSLRFPLTLAQPRFSFSLFNATLFYLFFLFSPPSLRSFISSSSFLRGAINNIQR